MVTQLPQSKESVTAYSLQTSNMYNDDELYSETERNITNQQFEEARNEHLIVRKHNDQARAKIDREIAELDRAIEEESHPEKHDTEKIKGYSVHTRRFASKEEFESFEKQGDVDDNSAGRIWHERLSPSLKKDSAANQHLIGAFENAHIDSHNSYHNDNSAGQIWHERLSPSLKTDSATNQHLIEAFENSHNDSNNSYHHEQEEVRVLKKHPISQSRDHSNSRHGNEDNTQRPVSPTRLEVYGDLGEPRKTNRYCTRNYFEDEDGYHVRSTHFYRTGKKIHSFIYLHDYNNFMSDVLNYASNSLSLCLSKIVYLSCIGSKSSSFANGNHWSLLPGKSVNSHCFWIAVFGSLATCARNLMC